MQQVLGFSALATGAAWMTGAGPLTFAGLAQKVVTRTSTKAAMAAIPVAFMVIRAAKSTRPVPQLEVSAACSSIRPRSELALDSKAGA